MKARVKSKRIPLRVCIVCGAKRPKKELIRIVRTPKGKVVIDYDGKKSGRGAYLCLKKDCIDKARREEQLEHALRIEIPSCIYEELERLLTTGGEVHGENKSI